MDAENSHNDRCCSSFLRAARKGHFECAHLLSKSLSKSLLFEAVNAHDNTGMSPLHLTSRRGMTDFISLLVTAGACVTWKDWNGCTALHYVSLSEDEGCAADCALVLLSAGADVSARNLRDETPLHWGAKRCALLRVLLSGGALVTEKDDDGWTALHHATRYPVADQACLKALLDSKPSLISETTGGGLTALNLACISAVHEDLEGGDSALAAIETLIKYGADVNFVPEDGEHIITELCRCDGGKRQCAAVRLLTRHGVMVRPGGLEVVRAVLNSSTDFLRCLLEVPGVDFSAQDPRNNSVALVHAVSQLDAVKLLIDAGADVNCRAGATPLMACALIHPSEDGYGDSGEVFRILLTAGARLSFVCCCPGNNATCGPSVLCEAAQHHNKEVLLQVLHAGIDPDSLCMHSSFGDPPLVMALKNSATYGHEVIKLLLAYGANPNAVVDKLLGNVLLDTFCLKNTGFQALSSVLSLLLRFSLCIGQHEGCCKETVELASSPRSLTHFCRAVICASIRENCFRGPCFLDAVHSLPLPPLMSEYLLEPYGIS